MVAVFSPTRIVLFYIYIFLLWFVFHSLHSSNLYATMRLTNNFLFVLIMARSREPLARIRQTLAFVLAASQEN
jgi:hypothetical protein